MWTKIANWLNAFPLAQRPKFFQSWRHRSVTLKANDIVKPSQKELKARRDQGRWEADEAYRKGNEEARRQEALGEFKKFRKKKDEWVFKMHVMVVMVVMN